MDIRLFINRGLAYSFTAAVGSAMLIPAARFVAPAWTTESFLVHPDVLIVAIVVLAMLSSPSQRFFSRVIDPYLYRGRVNYSSALREATRQLSRLMQPVELSAELRQVLTQAFVPEMFVMLVRAFEREAFEQLSGDQLPVAELLTPTVLLTEQPNPGVVLVNPTREVGNSRIAHETLKAAGVEVVVTLGRRGQLLGLVLLGPRRGGDGYFDDDLAFIESLAELSSIALANALLYRQR